MAEEIQLTHFHDLPIGSWFRFDIGGEPGLAISKKVSERFGLSDDQVVEIWENVWWVKNYIPQMENEEDTNHGNDFH